MTYLFPLNFCSGSDSLVDFERSLKVHRAVCVALSFEELSHELHPVQTECVQEALEQVHTQHDAEGCCGPD